MSDREYVEELAAMSAKVRAIGVETPQEVRDELRTAENSLACAAGLLLAAIKRQQAPLARKELTGKHLTEENPHA